MVAEKISSEDPNEREGFRSMLGPQHIDHEIRQAIQFCWMALPEDKRTVDEVEKQIRRLVDRALKDLREDSEAFGIGGGGA